MSIMCGSWEAIAFGSNRKYETATVLQKQDSVEMLLRIEAIALFRLSKTVTISVCNLL
jgi:hypothetical protein